MNLFGSFTANLVLILAAAALALVVTYQLYSPTQDLVSQHEQRITQQDKEINYLRERVRELGERGSVDTVG